MEDIIKYLTPYNHTEGSASRIQYLVIHYVGALGGAKANCEYYAGGDRGASAHYYVGFEGEIYQSVEDANIAWHCGAKQYVHAECRNKNSIGIELCVRKKDKEHLGDTDKDWYFEDATIASGVELTRCLMQKYTIHADHVIRHYDVTGKICPNPYVYNTTSHTWEEFQNRIQRETEPAEKTPGQWIQNETGWWWKNPDGTYPANQWMGINGQWYYFDGRGYMANQQWIGDYYLTESGAMAVNQWIGKYFVDTSGKWVPDKSSGSDWMVRLQQELNDQFGAKLILDGSAGTRTLAACPTVKRGAKGKVTKLIQEKLDLVADGIFGSGTESEVKRYQEQRGLASDGIVGKGTWKELLAL